MPCQLFSRASSGYPHSGHQEESQRAALLVLFAPADDLLASLNRLPRSSRAHLRGCARALSQHVGAWGAIPAPVVVVAGSSSVVTEAGL